MSSQIASTAVRCRASKPNGVRQRPGAVFGQVRVQIDELATDQARGDRRKSGGQLPPCINTQIPRPPSRGCGPTRQETLCRRSDTRRVRPGGSTTAESAGLSGAKLGCPRRDETADPSSAAQACGGYYLKWLYSKSVNGPKERGGAREGALRIDGTRYEERISHTWAHTRSTENDVRPRVFHDYDASVTLARGRGVDRGGRGPSPKRIGHRGARFS
jgi:hypothetical protein